MIILIHITLNILSGIICFMRDFEWSIHLCTHVITPYNSRDNYMVIKNSPHPALFPNFDSVRIGITKIASASIKGLDLRYLPRRPLTASFDEFIPLPVALHPKLLQVAGCQEQACADPTFPVAEPSCMGSWLHLL
jgi:hypothetical protein